MMKKYLAIGLMSGTSMDGIDAALLETDGEGFIKAYAGNSGLTIQYTTEMQLLLKALEYAVKKFEGNLALANVNLSTALEHYLKQELNIINIDDTLNQLQYYIQRFNLNKIDYPSIEEISTRLHYKAISTLLYKYNIDPTNINVVGYHGQTLYHNPSKKITIQMGDGELLAKLTKTMVVNDFRKNDVLHGGQGAPFAPIYHQALAKRDHMLPVIVLNIGGIANVTIINGAKDDDIIAHDTGPGNGLLDRFIRIKTNNKYFMDANGCFSKKGKVNYKVLDDLLTKACVVNNKNFFNIIPPKSLDINDLILIPELMQLTINDACRTLVEFTVKSIVDSFKLIDIDPIKYLVVAGGGSENPVIMEVLKKHASETFCKDLKVMRAEEIAWNNDTLEAEIFAYLAVRSINKLPLSLPNTTNVPYPLSGGVIHSISLS